LHILLSHNLLNCLWIHFPPDLASNLSAHLFPAPGIYTFYVKFSPATKFGFAPLPATSNSLKPLNFSKIQSPKISTNTPIQTNLPLAYIP
jgi:hypothetical protein